MRRRLRETSVDPRTGLIGRTFFAASLKRWITCSNGRLSPATSENVSAAKVPAKIESNKGIFAHINLNAGASRFTLLFMVN